MKELSKEQCDSIAKKHYKSFHGATAIEKEMLQEAYRLGQQDAGVDEQRFQAACAALTGYVAAGANGMPEPEQLAYYSVSAADALIAELNRTASDAEKGGGNG